ncbi:SMP-30/gluconolactonase/LRE family protein [Novosphingobium sp. KN65.2]|uniref:SMP-30/gluconolactonase/LRE family protein n=1 Tax=Novosphingobium sp. KN65.2 TaxID=1478134 RepID=UPI0005E3C253|nr:SMP-30/gluconolactonase/LRE family protein [Novosphingobium sp. KN65.2]CDO37842.1 putative gluconolactonase [Novosphingobium sp. KN65.2]
MELEIVAEGLGFPEGPIAMADGSVIVVDTHGGRLLRVAMNGAVSPVAETGGGPNGAAIGPDGMIYVCNNGGFAWSELEGGQLMPHGVPSDYRGGSIQRVDPESGRVETLYTACEGRALRGPNDIVFDSQGGFWFTDFGKTSEDRVDIGYIYYAKADGSGIRQALGGLNGPNGIGLSPDEKTLYWAETPTARLWAAEISGPGQVAQASVPWLPGRLVLTMPGYCYFDSLAVERDGRVVVGTLIEGGLTVIAPDGAHEHIAFPEIGITNICFGGKDMREAWATASSSGRLYRVRWPRPGASTAYNR